MKNFLDRTMPLGSPHPLINKHIANSGNFPESHKHSKKQKIFLVSSAGLPEMKHFEPLVCTFKYIAKELKLKYLGEILRPAGGLLQDPDRKDRAIRYSKNLQLAGRQLTEHEAIEEALLIQLHKLWMTKQEYEPYMDQKVKEWLDV